MHRWLCILLLAAAWLPGGDAVQTLMAGLEHPNFWTAVHAAEYLIDLRQAPEAVDAFVARKRGCASVPVERIGLWRVMALRAEGAERAAAIACLRRAAFAEPPAPDQTHAIETLLKLQYRCTPREASRLRAILKDSASQPGLQIYSAALLALAEPEGYAALERLLERHREEPVWCGVLLYALRLVPSPTERLFAQVQAICREAPSESHRVAAAFLLLNHRRMRFAEIPRLPSEPGKDALALLWLHAPKSPAFRQMLERMRQSDTIELRLFAAYIAAMATSA